MELPEIVRAYMDACCRLDLEAYLATFAPDGTYTDPGTGQPLSGAAITAYLGGLFAAFPDTTFETVAIDAIDEHLSAWRWVMRGTNSGSFAGFPPTGRKIALPGCEFIEVQAGRVQRVEGYFDRMTMLGQLGLMPPPASRPS